MNESDRKRLYRLFRACLDAEYTTVENDGSFAMYGEHIDGGHSERLYIFFEKSNGEEDWANNLSFSPASHSVGLRKSSAKKAVAAYNDMDERWYCHEGFLRVWKSIIPYIEDVVADERFSEAVIVGYSHGAAIAVLCHEYIWFNRPDMRGKITGYGFGCPRVIYGTVPRERERWSNFYVIRNLDDIVTHLPPQILGYRHVGSLVNVGRAGRYSRIEAHTDKRYLESLSEPTARNKGRKM